MLSDHFDYFYHIEDSKDDFAQLRQLLQDHSLGEKVGG